MSPAHYVILVGTAFLGESIVLRKYCPNCRSKDIRRSHRRNLLERLLSFVCIYPFRCDSCGERFKKLHFFSNSLRKRSP